MAAYGSYLLTAQVGLSGLIATVACGLVFSGYGRRTQFVPGHGSVCGVQVVREQAKLMDDLRAHAEKMIRSGVTAEEAERRYVVPKSFQTYRNHAWGWTVGAAMQSFYLKLAPRH